MADEVDITEDLTSHPENFHEQQDHVGEDSIITNLVGNESKMTITSSTPELNSDQFFVATSQGIFPAEQITTSNQGIKNCILIHDQATFDSLNLNGVRTIGVGSNPLIAQTTHTVSVNDDDRNRQVRKYDWDPSAYDAELPVRCKNTNGYLHKSKFGSGGRGKCIKSDGAWFTPTEWETYCGRASSKDWKKSIRYAGRQLSCLIEDGILRPHSGSCTCSSCCNDDRANGPVRFFTPYRKRRPMSPNTLAARSRNKRLTTRPAAVTEEGHQTVHIKDSSGRIVEMRVHLATSTTSGEQVSTNKEPECKETMLQDTPTSTAPSTSTLIANTVSEPDHFSQLEQMAENLQDQLNALKDCIKFAKLQSEASKAAALETQRQLMEKEKVDAVNSARLACQVQVTRALNDLGKAELSTPSSSDMKVEEDCNLDIVNSPK
ncbi:DEAF1 [Bugula neritina]|uniref:DEAF1 n=1 Tax=Bugula neritina TaxID=10212 RepID=A0A7J7ITM9_BUGNE|nr:DEAF1 [Bugula neritina]